MLGDKLKVDASKSIIDGRPYGGLYSYYDCNGFKCPNYDQYLLTSIESEIEVDKSFDL
jgi:hypothetical protein